MKLNPPSFLLAFTTVGFFFLVGLMCFHEIPESSQNMVAQLIGVIGTAWGAIVAYHFGSSAGSAAKTAIMAAKPPDQSSQPEPPKDQP